MLLSSGLLEMERAVAEVQDTRGLLTPAGLAGGNPGTVVMLILPFPLYGSELMGRRKSTEMKRAWWKEDASTPRHRSSYWSRR